MKTHEHGPVGKVTEHIKLLWSVVFAWENAGEKKNSFIWLFKIAEDMQVKI